MEAFKLHGIDSLSSDDLLLIDHSENDACAIVNREELFIANGLELLIRTLSQLSRGSFPMMMILEHWPHETSVNFKDGAADGKYVRIYRKVAAHYGIPIFSYREVVWSRHLADKQAQLKRVMTGFDLHPPWHGHLLAADTYASCLVTLLGKCNPGRDQNEVTDPFPEPLYNVSNLMRTEFCDPEFPYLLDARPNTSFQPSNLAAFEEDLTGWTEYIDRHGEPGWMINNSSNPSSRVLSFDFQTQDKLSKYVVKVKYLRTHFNAGKVNVKLCGGSLSGSPPRIIDALMANFSEYKVSIPHIFIMNPTIWEIIRCPLPNAKLELVYELGNSLLEARDHQKVKIFSVQVCRPLNNDNLL